jgi:hypothetical protein
MRKYQIDGEIGGLNYFQVKIELPQPCLIIQLQARCSIKSIVESAGFQIHKAVDFETTAFSWYAEGFFTCLDCREQHVP